MLDIRKRIFIALGVIAGIIIAIVLWYLYSGQGNNNVEQNQSNNQVNSQTGEQNNNTVNSNVPLTVIKETPEDYAKQVARTFVERFATYSNQNDNRNIEDAVSMSTDMMVKWLKTQIQPLNNEYSGVTTKVIASRVEKIDEGSAKVSVETQQIWENTTTQETKQRLGSVDLVKVEGEWKVDGFYWGK